MPTMDHASRATVWGENIGRESIGGVPYLNFQPRPRRLPELFEDATRWGERDHLVQGDRRLTFGHCLAAIEAVGDHLADALSVAPGDRVLILAANSPEWVIAFWATLSLGAVAAPGNGWWSEEEVAHALELVEPTVVIGDQRRLERVPADVRTIEVSELRPLVDGAAARKCSTPSAAAVDGDENEPALIVFTAGTTGLSKGATLAHRSWISTLHQTLASSHRLPHQLPSDAPGGASLLTGPLFHIGGLHALALSFIGGGKLAFLEGRFDAGEVLDIIERERIEVWGAIPTMTIRVLDELERNPRDVSSVRSVPLGGAPVSTELIARIERAFPGVRRRVTNVYGMTETSGTVARASGRLMAEHPGVTGEPLPAVELRIADPDEDGVGEILVRTPGQMLGYWKEGADTIDADGFLHTGDLGKLVDGRLHVTGRLKDVIIRGGENIAAPHVESVLLQHPDVLDVAVVGLPHGNLGEEVGAAIVPRPGATLDTEELASYARSRMASFEVPTRWWQPNDPLPMTDSGKADKRRVRETFPTADS